MYSSSTPWFNNKILFYSLVIGITAFLSAILSLVNIFINKKQWLIFKNGIFGQTMIEDCVNWYYFYSMFNDRNSQRINEPYYTLIMLPRVSFTNIFKRFIGREIGSNL